MSFFAWNAAPHPLVLCRARGPALAMQALRILPGCSRARRRGRFRLEEQRDLAAKQYVNGRPLLELEAETEAQGVQALVGVGEVAV